MTHYPKIGSVSEGTLRTEDLLDTFAAELSYHMKRMRLTREQRKRFNFLLRETYNLPEEWPGDSGEGLVADLQEALSEIAAPYSYFGTAEGDGACFGFWPNMTEAEFALPKLPAEYPEQLRHWWGEDVLLVNDHGNVECGHVDKRGKFHEYWSCV